MVGTMGAEEPKSLRDLPGTQSTPISPEPPTLASLPPSIVALLAELPQSQLLR